MFRWDPYTVAVPPYPRPFGQKLRRGAYVCVMCRQLLTWVVEGDLDHAGDCPGQVTPATGELSDQIGVS